MVPARLEEGDRVAVVAPSRSLAIISKPVRDIALGRLGELGLEVAMSRHAEEIDDFTSSSIRSRVEDLHWAFESKEIKAILTVIGGFNSNQLLRDLDYGLIEANPKIFCGFSDITALQNAILAKTGLVTYSGPHFSSFGMKKGFEYTLEGFRQCLFSSTPLEISPSESWSDDAWYLDQEKRNCIRNAGPRVINAGEARGKVIGGNLCTFNLIQGTEFMPDLKDSILFIEDDEETKPYIFDRDLQSLIHQPGFDGVGGIAIGRFQNASKITFEMLSKIIKTKRELVDIPVIADLDFGHTTPQITFPVGGKAEMRADAVRPVLRITEH